MNNWSEIGRTFFLARHFALVDYKARIDVAKRENYRKYLESLKDSCNHGIIVYDKLGKYRNVASHDSRCLICGSMKRLEELENMEDRVIIDIRSLSNEDVPFINTYHLGEIGREKLYEYSLDSEMNYYLEELKEMLENDLRNSIEEYLGKGR